MEWTQLGIGLAVLVVLQVILNYQNIRGLKREIQDLKLQIGKETIDVQNVLAPMLKALSAATTKDMLLQEIEPGMKPETVEDLANLTAYHMHEMKIDIDELTLGKSN